MWIISDSSKKEFIKISDKQFNEKYQIIQSLGKGAYGEVSKAKSVHNNLVAIKKFKPEAVMQFHSIIREISNLKKLDHPNILKFYDCYIVNQNRYYMVTEYCPERSLTDFIPKITQDWERLLICQQIAEGLAHAHSFEIVHRDLKPENILIGVKNVAKIGDFGCSTRIQNNEVLTSRVGSPAYMDERVDKRQEYDNTADIYSLGMIYLCIYKGKGIYDECINFTDLKRIKSEINRDYDKNIQSYIEDLPSPMKDIVKNCLNPDHRIRYSAEVIANMIGSRLAKQKNGSRNLISTQDELEQLVQTEKNIFACHLIAMSQKFQFKHRCLKTREDLFKLLVKNQLNFEKIANIQTLKYVCTDTKAQFTFIVILCYRFWLEQINLIINSEYSELESRYKQIDPKTIEQEVLIQATTHISRQKEKISPALLRCAQKIIGTLHLLSHTQYLPERFKQFINAVCQRQPINFNQTSYSELINNIRTFFEKRIKKEYQYTRGEEKPDQKLDIIRSISDSFV